MSKRLLSLFSGCGGMDLGFHGDFSTNKKSILNHNWIRQVNSKYVKLKKTDFEIVFANDIIEYAKRVWADYFLKEGLSPEIYKVGSIVDLVKSHKKGKKIFPDNIDIITGGFPCQDFSIAGKRLAFLSHKSHDGGLLRSYENPDLENRGELYMWMREVIGIVKPKIFIAENVRGMKSLPNVVETIKKDFESIEGEEYLVLNPKVLHAGKYGVPQSRERIIFIGLKVSALKTKALSHYRSNILPDKYDLYPPETHFIENLNGNGSFFDKVNLQKFVSPRDAFEDLVEPWKSRDLSHQSRSKAKYYGNHVQGQIEIKPDDLGPTIRAEHHGNIEFRRLNKKNGGKIEHERGLWQRRLTLRECAILQTFPQSYNFVINKPNYKVSISQGYRLVGNAVPPILAYNIAMRIQELWSTIFSKEKS
jgi:DNA (cytosine-5)-methyltransferase 1